MTVHVPAHPTTHANAERALLATLIVAAAVVLAALAVLIVPQLAPTSSTSPMVVGDDGWRQFRAEERSVTAPASVIGDASWRQFRAEEQGVSIPASVIGDASWRQYRAEERTVQDPYLAYMQWRAEERGS